MWIYCCIVWVLGSQLGTQFSLPLTHKLNDAGSNTDPCGTPNFEYKRFEQRESICTR